MTLQERAEQAGMTIEALAVAAYERHGTQKAAGAALGVSASYLGKILRSAGVSKFKRFSKRDEKRILTDLERGRKVAQVARDFDCTPGAIRQLLRRHGKALKSTLVTANSVA